MKVHQQQQQLTRGFWDHHNHHHNSPDHHETTSLSLSCKRLRPLAPKLSPVNDVVVSSTSTPTAAFDLKSFIRPDSGPRKLAPAPPSEFKKDPLQHAVETHPGGTRWNPTQEQIGILEALYCRGMRTPNAQQIEQITAQLSKYGKIEGKNVFYWFQNHKARERQKQKRNPSVLGLTANDHSPKTTSFLSTNAAFFDTSSITLSFDSPTKEESKREDQVTTPSKRKGRSWTFEGLIEESAHANKFANLKSYTDDDGGEEEERVTKITLELFPLHPEVR